MKCKCKRCVIVKSVEFRTSLSNDVANSWSTFELILAMLMILAECCRKDCQFLRTFKVLSCSLCPLSPVTIFFLFLLFLPHKDDPARARLPSSRVKWKRLKHSSREAVQKKLPCELGSVSIEKTRNTPSRYIRTYRGTCLLEW